MVWELQSYAVSGAEEKMETAVSSGYTGGDKNIALAHEGLTMFELTVFFNIEEIGIWQRFGEKFELSGALI